MSAFYGVMPKELDTPSSPVIVASSGITIAFGTAPAHQVGGKANTVVTANTMEEAVSALGYSADWKKYTLCEVMYSHFTLYKSGPLMLVNILDAAKHKETKEEETVQIFARQAKLAGDAIPESIVVKKELEGNYEIGTDYDVLYNEDGECVIEVLPDGAIASEGKESLTVTYDEVKFTLDELKEDMIGGYDPETSTSTGLELIDKAYFQDRVLPDIMIAPGFSHIPEIASIMAAKTRFSEVFRGICICDLDTDKAKTYQDAAKVKNENACYTNKKQVIVWPELGLEDMEFHYSTQLAGLMCNLDKQSDNVPSTPIGNKALMADRAMLADGTQVLLDLTQANFLRSQGLVTAYNFVNGFTSWGAYTGCYPASNDPKDIFINETRMFNYVSNAVVLTYWSRIDEKLTPRYAESIIDGLGMWLNGLVTGGHLLGARCEFKSEENPREDIVAGIVRVHVYITPPAPAQEVDFLLEYDVSYVDAAFGLAA